MRFSHTLVIALNTFREAVRDRVLYNLVAFALILIASAILFAEISIGVQKTILLNVGLSSISIFGLLIAIFLGIGLVYKEIERRSLYSLLSKPIHRRQFVVGKFLGLNFTLLVNTIFMSVGLWAALYYVARAFTPEDQSIWVAIYFILLQLWLVTAICLFFSCFSTPVLSAVFTFVFYIVGTFSSDIRAFGELTENPALKTASTVIYYLLPNFSDFNVSAWVAHGQPVAARLIWLNTLYALLYGGSLVGASVMIFARKDLK
ncbi:MAG: ABC transporter permease subunit [Acidobacteria bacterium]|nr:ABC transporter permease subunit [Acidobacteriota bacterium]